MKHSNEKLVEPKTMSKEEESDFVNEIVFTLSKMRAWEALRVIELISNSYNRLLKNCVISQDAIVTGLAFPDGLSELRDTEPNQEEINEVAHYMQKMGGKYVFVKGGKTYCLFVE